MHDLITAISNIDRYEIQPAAEALLNVVTYGSGTNSTETFMEHEAKLIALLLEAAAMVAAEHGLCPCCFGQLAHAIAADPDADTPTRMIAADLGPETSTTH